MSGHSKWSTIKRKKGANDAARAKVFTKLAREISVAVKEGGTDPNNNSRLRDLMAKGRAANVPQDNLLRAVKKAGDNDKESYESIVYEGYGQAGIAVIVECLTDNRNRTASNMRHYFDKFGGNLGNSGCVSFMFHEQGVIVLDVEGKNEEVVMEDAFDAGAEDFDIGDDIAEIMTSAAAFSEVREALEKKGYNFISAEVAMVPATETALTDPEDIKKMGLLLDHLDDDDDVQNVWHNLENEDDLDR